MEVILKEMTCLWTAVLREDRKSTRLNSSHVEISYAVFCLKKKINRDDTANAPQRQGLFSVSLPVDAVPCDGRGPLRRRPVARLDGSVSDSAVNGTMDGHE